MTLVSSGHICSLYHSHNLRGVRKVSLTRTQDMQRLSLVYISDTAVPRKNSCWNTCDSPVMYVPLLAPKAFNLRMKVSESA